MEALMIKEKIKIVYSAFFAFLFVYVVMKLGVFFIQAENNSLLYSFMTCISLMFLMDKIKISELKQGYIGSISLLILLSVFIYNMLITHCMDVSGGCGTMVCGMAPEIVCRKGYELFFLRIL